RHTAADALSRRSHKQKEVEAQKKEEDIDDFVQASFEMIHARVNAVSVTEIREESLRILNSTYSEKFEKIAHYLTTLQRSKNMSRKKFAVFKKKTLTFTVKDDQLFRRVSKNISLRRVMNCQKKRKKIFRKLHAETSHREREDINS